MSLHADVAVPARDRKRLERLCRYVARPPPRAHQVWYHGVLASCSSARDHVVPTGPEVLETALCSGEANSGSTGPADGGGDGDGEALVARASTAFRAWADRSESLPRRIAWADLLRRVFEVDALGCPACGGRTRLLAAITDTSVARWILESLALPPRAPPLAPAAEVRLEPAIGGSAFELTLAKTQSDPGFDFDQSPAQDRFSDEDS